jgi:ubiquinone/menaquinone biosynthesis C-methylase UbiE
MRFYGERIFPWLLDHAMRRRHFAAQRRQLLAPARGRVLEIGFGTGLNLPHYPAAVGELHALEPNRGALRLARSRVAAAAFPVHVHVCRADAALPFESGSFDTVTSTWTLCSIRELPRALAEVRRMLKPGAPFLFIEHGLSPEPGLARWQRRLTPLQRLIADGCHLDRDIPALLRAAGFALASLDTFELDGMPRLGSHTFRGRATAS